MPRGTDASESTFLVVRMDTKDIPFEARFLCNLLGAGMNRHDLVLDAVQALVVVGAFAAAGLRAFRPLRRWSALVRR